MTTRSVSPTIAVVAVHRAVPVQTQGPTWSSRVFEPPPFKIRDVVWIVLGPQFIGAIVGAILLYRAIGPADYPLDPASVPVGPFLWAMTVTAVLQLCYLGYLIIDRDLAPEELGWRWDPLDALLGIGATALLWGVTWTLWHLVPSLNERQDGFVESQMSEVFSQMRESSILHLILLVAVAAPVIEELVFRGVLYRALEDWFGRVAAVAGSSILFGLAHATTLGGDDIPIIVFATVAGLVFGTARAVTGRIGPGMLAHALHNLVVCLALSAAIS